MAAFLDDQTKMKAIRYTPPVPDKPKKITWLARTDRMFAAVQMLQNGGETNLHSHRHVDGFWFVLSGRARFYSDKDTVFAELGAYEGVLVPKDVKYWFESVGDEPLNLLQVECSDVSVQSMPELMSDRTFYGEKTTTISPTEFIEAPVVK
jgi:mannose-6-phosphate isomerase-like protein (cupin superfamily)